MAKRAAGVQSTGSYFRELFTANPEWLQPGTNAPLYDQWKKDHNGNEMNDSQKNIMANTKSVMRKKLRIGRPGRKPGRPRMAVAAGAPAQATLATMRTSPAMNHNLEQLEVAIDHCLSSARRLDAERLEKVIKYLRGARNEVVMQLG